MRNGGNSVADLSRYDPLSTDHLNKKLNNTLQYVGASSGNSKKSDPFANLNPKTRRLIETATNSKRTGSTGGSASRDNDINMTAYRKDSIENVPIAASPQIPSP